MLRFTTLIGRTQVDTARTCLGSLAHHSDEPVSFTVHDDGSLREEDLEALSSAFPVEEVIPRGVADERVNDLLAHYPSCRAYRDHHNLGMKLFDICLLQENDETIRFSDSDVFFQRPFSLPAFDTRTALLVMQDNEQAFSVLPWHLKPFGPLRVVSRANTGLMYTRPSHLDLDYVEYLLSHPRMQFVFGKRPQWVEQTCWSALASRLDAYTFDPAQVLVAKKDMTDIPDTAVAVHFVSDYRYHLKDFAKHASVDLTEPVPLQVKRRPHAHPIHIFNDELRRRGRRVRRWLQKK